MRDLFKVADLFVERVKEDYPQDVAIVGYYGSYAEGTQNPKSDIDLFFIPNTDRGWELGDTFILEDIGIDLFPISWKRAEKIAAYNETIVSVLADCKILYAGSEEDLVRFEDLRNQIKSLSKPENRAVMVKKALEVFNRTFISLSKLDSLRTVNDYSAVRVEAFRVMTAVLESTALLNQTYLKKGWGKNLEEVYAYEIKPNHIKELIEAIISEADCCGTLIDYCKMLVDNTRELFLKEEALLKKESDFNIFKGYYEEMKSYFNKITQACEANDYRTAFFAVVNLQQEIVSFLIEGEGDFKFNGIHTFNENKEMLSKYNLLDLVEKCQLGKLQELKMATLAFEKRLVEILEDKGIEIKSFSSIDEYENYVKVGAGAL